MGNPFVSTATWFGRSRNELKALMEALAESNTPNYKTLQIGPGYSTIDKICYEPIELSASLQQLKKPWSLTIMDYNPEVCDCIRKQTRLIINNSTVPCDSLEGLADYTRRFLATLGTTSNETHGVAVKIPSEIRERISVVEGDLTKPETFPNGVYDVIVILNVFYYVPKGSEQKQVAVNTLYSKVADGGMVLSDFKMDGLKVIRTIPGNERADKRLDDAYISRKL